MGVMIAKSIKKARKINCMRFCKLFYPCAQMRDFDVELMLKAKHNNIAWLASWHHQHALFKTLLDAAQINIKIFI